MRVVSRRRPELMLLASLLIFSGVLAWQALADRVSPPAAFSTGAPAPAPVELSAESTIARLQERIRRNPEDTAAYAQLGQALLLRVRETGDPSLYERADQAFAAALQRDPDYPDALIGQGALALARHHFAEALRLGEHAHAVNPFSAVAYGIIGDAQVELGQYDAAVATVQKMVDTRPDLGSYSRVSYLRELHGDTAGAIEAMRQAVEAGGPVSEQTLWTQVQLGHLYFNSGDLERAEHVYLQALEARPDYLYAVAGVARVRAAQGKFGEAIDYYRKIVEALPLPEFVIALGDLYAANGQPDEAQRQYDLVRAMQQLNAESGMDVDLELALFEADHATAPAGSAAAAANLQRARAAYARRPGIYGADALAWTLYSQGAYAEARRYSQEALRLGTRDALLHYHAGMIAYALDDRAAAREYLREALSINPFFSVRYAPLARQTLAELE